MANQLADTERLPQSDTPSYAVPPNTVVYNNRRMSRRDSGLEAFSRNPPDGSLAPLAVQPSAKPSV